MLVGTCPKCKARIYRIKNKNGGLIPCEAQTHPVKLDPAGQRYITAAGDAVYGVVAGTREADVYGFRPHEVTCEAMAAARKEKARQQRQARKAQSGTRKPNTSKRWLP